MVESFNTQLGEGLTINEKKVNDITYEMKEERRKYVSYLYPLLEEENHIREWSVIEAKNFLDRNNYDKDEYNTMNNYYSFRQDDPAKYGDFKTDKEPFDLEEEDGVHIINGIYEGKDGEEKTDIVSIRFYHGKELDTDNEYLENLNSKYIRKDNTAPAFNAIETVVDFNDLPVDTERDWDGNQAQQNIADWASSDGSGDKDKIDWDKYRKGFCYYDSDEEENFTSYKFPIADVVDGQLKAIWNGIVAAMAAINGSRSEPDMPEDERKGVYNHLVKYYEKLDEEPPEYKG